MCQREIGRLHDVTRVGKQNPATAKGLIGLMDSVLREGLLILVGANARMTRGLAVPLRLLPAGRNHTVSAARKSV